MSTRQFDNANLIVTVQGREITDWGQTDPPFTSEPIDATSQLNRGLGGNAVSFRRSNPGLRYTLNLLPGSPDSAFLTGLLRSNAVIEGSSANVGTLEEDSGSQGIIIGPPTKGRGGPGITDDTWVIEFNVSDNSFGGEI